MKTIRFLLNFFVVLCLGLAGLPQGGAKAQSVSGPASPAGLLNPDGTLNLDGSFSGSLDLEGYTISLDPQKGPLFKPQAAGTEGDWEAISHGPGMVGSHVYAIAVAVDGVYVGGAFGDINNTPNTANFAKWTGTAWEGVGRSQSLYSLNNPVRAIALWGQYVYVGGDFTNVNNGLTAIPEADYVARWDGENWTSLYHNGAGGGSLNNKVHALNIDEDYLYVGGEFTDVNNGGATLNAADYFALYNLGSDEWEALGSDNSGNGSLNNAVVAIDVNDYGVYAGGFFTDVKNPGGALNNADYIAHWNGGAWEALSSNGAGNGSLNFPVLSLAHTGFGTDTLVYVGGQFNDVKYGITTLSNADFVARWEPDSSAWETIPGAPALNAYVHSISISGSSILLGGSFTNAAGLAEADYAALWNGSAWTALGSDGAGDGSLDQAVRATAIKNGKYYVGGHFALESNGTPMPDADYFAIWNGSAWNSAGGYNGSFFYSNMLTMASSGSQVYFGGSVTNFYNNGTYNPNADSVFRWDGTAWNHLGAGDFEESSILDIAINGSDIYVVGSFQNGAGIPEADYIAKWDGVAWSALGSDGMGDGALKGSINALLVSGSEVYVGGNFIDAAGIPNANYIAKWNGSAWSAVGSASAINASVLALEKIGNTLYAGGNFLNAGGVAGADYLAKFDGTNWSTVGSNPLILGSVYTLAALNNDLYVGGSFLVSGIPGAENIAKFDGANWSALDSGLTAPVYSIAAAGTNIYAGGTFTNAGGVPAADYIAKWDGANWSALGSNGAGDGSLNSWVEAVEIANGRVYVAGPFANVNNNGTALNAADYVAAFVVDTTAPTVTSITRASANPTTAASVDFEVTFSESVTNVGTADFSLGKTGGVSGEGITSVSGSGTLYTVTVNTGTGAGTLRLDIPDTSAITDATGNTLAGLPYTSGPSYSIRTQTFADVPTNHWAWNYIERLYSAGITGGCTITPLNYCPTQSVTRAQMAVFLLVASHGSGYVPPAPSGIFADVPVGNPYAAWVEQLANEGITGGCGGNNYCPNSPVTRRQMAVFLLVAEHGSGYTPPAATGMFADVPVNDPFAAWIEQLANEGITGGCGGGNYCPTLSVNRGQMAVFLVKTFNLP